MELIEAKRHLNLIPAGHHPHPKKIKAMFVSGRLPVG
jgi:hypothetical protein